MTVVLSQFGQSIETDVEKKVKFPTGSWSTAENISTVDRRAIPSVTGFDARRDKHIISVAFFSGYSDNIVKEMMEMFNSKTFMARLREDIVV